MVGLAIVAWLTSAPREIQLKMPQAAAEQLASWPDDIALFTPASKPLRSLTDVAPGEVAIAGPELALMVHDLMVASGGNGSVTGMRIIAPGEEVDIFRRQRGIRLLITSASRTEQIQQNHGARVLFQGQ